MERGKILGKLLMLAPGLFVALIFFLLRDHTTAMILVTMDISTALLQTWWVANSQRIVDTITRSWFLRNNRMGFVYKYHRRNPITIDIIRIKLGLVSRYQ